MVSLKVIGPQANCKDCIGACCVYYTSVFLDTPDVERIRKHLKLSTEDFRNQYLKDGGCGQQRKDGGIDWFGSIKTDKNGFCIFFNNGCSINDVKPKICADYKMNEKMCRDIFTTRNGGVINIPNNVNGGRDRIIRLLEQINSQGQSDE
jgi:Fe-S-cluster containining protein